jgi:aspartate racemase
MTFRAEGRRQQRRQSAIGEPLGFLICPDNTIHKALPHVVQRSPLPWLHIAEEVAREAVARGFKRLAITGTRWLVDSQVYPDALRAQGTGLHAPGARGAPRDQPHHHGAVGLQRL